MAVTLPEGEEKRRVVEGMFDRIAPRYDLVNGVISLGAHRRWKRAAVAALGVAPGARVLDLGCGTGDLLAEAARLGAVGIGADVSAGMLAAARERGIRGALLRASGDRLPLRSASLDGLVCGFALRNVVSIETVLGEAARVLRPGARAAFVEVDRPRTAFLGGAHRLWFDGVVPLLGGLLSDAAAYRYLASSTAYLPAEAELRRMLAAAGFARVTKRSLLLGSAQLVIAERGGAR